MNFHARRFDRAAGSYGAHSAVQARMAARLAGLPPRESTPARILEMGCGTGHLTRLLRARFPLGNMLVTDAAPRMLEAARGALRLPAAAAPPATAPSTSNLVAPIASTTVPETFFTLFDAEGASPAPAPISSLAPFSIAASNALVQWFPDLARHFHFVAGLLESGGHYLVSGFHRDNFPELNALLREPAFGYADFPGHDEGMVRTAAEAAGLDVDILAEENLPERYASPREFLRVITGLGSARKPGRALTRNRLELLEKIYLERHPWQGGVKATWRPWYALLKKP
jgi:malonyl-CoA O-methyltransferase